MSVKDDGGPAFPLINEQLSYANEGMTMRDWFAAKAMQGMLSGAGLGHMNVHPSYYDSLASTANTAYRIADAMLEARKE